LKLFSAVLELEFSNLESLRFYFLTGVVSFSLNVTYLFGEVLNVLTGDDALRGLVLLLDT
jgi:hypothetical protein